MIDQEAILAELDSIAEDLSNRAWLKADCARTAVRYNQAWVVPCLYCEADASEGEVDFVAEILWREVVEDIPGWNTQKWEIMYAPFSQLKPHRIGRGKGEKESWIVIQPERPPSEPQGPLTRWGTGR